MLVRHKGTEAFNPYLSNKNINIEVKLTQYKEGSNPGVRTQEESRITMNLPMVMNSNDSGINFTATGQANITFEVNDSSINSDVDLSGEFLLSQSDNDIYLNYLNLLKQFYATLDDISKQNLESHFDVKSYLSVSLNNNFVNSAYPLWRSFDVFEGPVEYYSSESGTDFDNLLYFDQDVLEINEDQRSVCIFVGNKTEAVVSANLVVRGPEHFDYNSEVPLNNEDLIISNPSPSWASSDEPVCIDISKSANYDNGAYDRMEAYYYLEIVPEIGATTYRGDKLLIQVGDKIR